MTDTIYALATPPGRSAVAVVRLSGPASLGALQSLTDKAVQPRLASLRRLRHPASNLVIDQALVLRFDAPASFTGEDSVELHLHGGRGVVAQVLDALACLSLRLAEPGEFTRRAFENGKLDLAQAEAVADLIDAETQAQTRQAIAQLDGALSDRHRAWRQDLTYALALLEAAVDFPDEDLPVELAASVAPILRRLQNELAAALAQAGRGQAVREGYRIALVGAPNAGKSSLLNALAARDIAIVTPQAGTTRDVIEASLDIAGYKVVIADTAGLRDTDDVVEQEGVRRARRWADAADLRLVLVDSTTPNDLAAVQPLLRPQDILVWSKCDLAAETADNHPMAIALSVLQPQTVADLIQSLQARVVEALSAAEFPFATQQRHSDRLREASIHIGNALACDYSDVELVAEDVRLAARALTRITGEIGAEDVLDAVFSTFCIGK